MLNIVILAAGMGKRMKSDLPKVLHGLAGRPMLTHVLGSARALGPARLVIVVGHGADTVRERYAAEGDLAFVLQQPQLGTGHAVQQAVPELMETGGDDDVTLVLYGDVPLVAPGTLRRLLEARAAQPGSLALLTVELDDATGYGRIVRNADGAVGRVVEHKDATEDERRIREVNTGIVAAPTAALKRWLAALRNDNAQQEYYLTDIVAMAAAEGAPVVAAQPDHVWETLGVNSRAQQAELEGIYRGAQAARLMEDGVTLADPARLDVRGELRCGRDVFIDVGCVFEGKVELADGVSVGPYCVLRDVRVAPGARIDAFSHLHEAEVGADARIGPYARIRPGTRLAERAHVGNFVEIKNSSLGADAKANHLSYVGDARVGARVNIGAGTITCNYDGASKHLTVIEDDAFIGSDSQLVAPVTVGKGATLGAGTTLTKDAPAGRLTLSRTTQTTREGWQRPAKQTR
ncbi:bifunctional UDP-N-acetylglucosamine diphosphorylase/glucosamine-1-phosphate N-acetyltransferase GlmU [Pigmentiphaga soli]